MGWFLPLLLVPLGPADDPAAPPGRPTVQGRVVDEAGQPLAGARVRLYLRAHRWERTNELLDQATTGPDGAFRFRTPLEPAGQAGLQGLPLRSRGLPPHVLVADREGKAVGWRVIPADARRFEGDVVLTTPEPRTVNVVGPDGRPVPGARVVAYTVGDGRSPRPEFREGLELRPEDGPLTAVADAEGHATFPQLPATRSSFVGSLPGFAWTYTFDKKTIRLTPAASLSGRVTGPDGAPLAAIKVVLFCNFLWQFEFAVTDADGRYRFDGLPAVGWDMGAWGEGMVGDGTYKVWIDDDRFATTTRTLTLEPQQDRAADMAAVVAGVIKVRLLERGSLRPVAGARIWGLDAETGSGARFNAYTDDDGRAVFYAAPTTSLSLSLAGPPEGVYVDGYLDTQGDTNASFSFEGGEREVVFLMPKPAGKLVEVGGVCTDADGKPAAGIQVYGSAGRYATAGSTANAFSARTDEEGRFTFRDVPEARTLHIYAEAADRAHAGLATVAQEKGRPAAPIRVLLRPTRAVSRVLVDDWDNPLATRKFNLTPKMDDDELVFVRRPAESDERGEIRLDGILPGLAYRVVEQLPPAPPGAVIRRIGANPSRFDRVIVFAPEP